MRAALSRDHVTEKANIANADCAPFVTKQHYCSRPYQVRCCTAQAAHKIKRAAALSTAAGLCCLQPIAAMAYCKHTRGGCYACLEHHSKLAMLLEELRLQGVAQV
eukprot:13526-Heterococcus_DN1.PRE.4